MASTNVPQTGISSTTDDERDHSWAGAYLAPNLSLFSATQDPPWTSMIQEKFLLGNLDDNESTVWRRLRQEAAQHRLANKALTKDLEIEELLEFLRVVFTESIVRDVKCSLIDIKESWAGWITSSGGTFFSYVQILISDLRREELPGTGMCVGQSAAGEEVKVTGAGEDMQNTTQGVREGLGVGEEGTIQGLREGVGDASAGFSQVRNKKQRREDRDPNDYGDGLNGRFIFQKMVPTVLTLGPYITLPKPFYKVAKSHLTPPHTLDIRNRSKRFAEHLLILACTPEFDMGLGPRFRNPHGEGSSVYLFHGTRSSCVSSFKAKGISPPSDSENGDFSRLPSFYCTTKARYAFEHPLLNHDHAHQEGKECDTVSVFCFQIPVSVLRGEAPPTRNFGKCFDVQYFSGEDDDWENFCNHNHSTHGSDKYYREVDITFGPVSVPSEDEKGNRIYRVLNIVGCKPKQVAFNTRASRAWLAHHLVAMYTEDRTETASSTSC